MPNYREQAVTGATWQRCFAVTMTNPLDGPKVVQFFEQTCVAFDGQVITRDGGSCGVQFAADGEFPLLDLETDQATGATISHAEVYAILYSLYRHAAALRDQLGEPPMNLEQPA